MRDGWEIEDVSGQAEQGTRLGTTTNVLLSPGKAIVFIFMVAKGH